VALGDVAGAGAADFAFGGGPQGGQRVLVLSGALVRSGGLATAQQNPAANFFVDGDGRSRSGVRVAVKDVDGDNRADVVTGSGTNQASQIRVYRGGSFPAAGEPEVIQNIDPFNQTLTTGLFVG